jgi:hypothetical protein
MNLTLRSEVNAPPGTLDSENTRAMTHQWLQDAKDGKLLMPTSEGWLRPPEAVAILAVFWWTRHPEANPVVLVFDDHQTRAIAWELPGEWNPYWCDRFQSDAEELDRQMNRGEEGKRLSSFRLGTIAELADFIMGSLSAYQEQAH